MEFNEINPNFEVKILTEKDAQTVYEMCIMNTKFYEYCPPMVTVESIVEDMKRLPPNKKAKDKYYLGLFDFGNLLAVIDLILDYPKNNIAFIGFFMVNKAYQGHGIGSSIINNLLKYLSSIGYTEVRLGYVKGNKQSENFWLKNNFINTNFVSKEELYDVIILHKYI